MGQICYRSLKNGVNIIYNFQVCPPRYSFLISELAGEQRFASVVARRLECMGALTHGDRRSVEKQQDLSRFNFDTTLGKKSLDLCLKSIRKFAQIFIVFMKEMLSFFSNIQKMYTFSKKFQIFNICHILSKYSCLIIVRNFF